jgi:glycosyltransferase involved in cell wall biosynthesis
MEAMASGCYCLSHRWRGANELLPEEYLFVSNSELLEKILMYSAASDTYKNEQRAHMRQIACREFDIEKTKRQIRSVIDEVGDKAKV